MKNLELLAPVGSMDSLYAAVANGADAVYLGGESFSARKHATNFNNEEMKEAISYAHENGVEVHVAVNILLSDTEVKEALDYIKFLYEIDVDAIIVQDMGLASLVLELFPELPIHGSTQMTINNLEGAKFLEKIGFSRVVLARETPLEEIKRIKENTNIEVEVFVHGALCVAYSGQCLMSSLIGGRSGNRGNCAQPCRMAYSIVDRDNNVLDGWDEKYVLSTRDLNALENIDELLEIGVDSFKIEGRMKRPEYVATIVSKYRKAIDRGSKNINEYDMKEVKQIFNREFTKGMTFGDFGNSYISETRPDNRGLYLGDVLRVDSNQVEIILKEDLSKGDGIEFTLVNDDYRGMSSPVEGKKGERIRVKRIGNIRENSKVYRTSSIELLEKAKLSYQEINTNKYPLDLKLNIRIGEKPKLMARFGKYRAEATDNFIVEESKNISLDYQAAYDQLSKLGESNFYINKLDTDIEEGSFVPVSVLNALRREVVDILNGKISNFNDREKIENYNERKSQLLNIEKFKDINEDKVSVRINDFRQIKELDTSKIDRIYLGFTRNIDRVLERLSKNTEVYLWTDKILYKEDFEKLDNTIENFKDRIDGVAVSNLGTLNHVMENYDLKIHGDMGLNIFNSYSANYFLSKGVSSISLSPELTAHQIREIKNTTGGDIEIIAYGYLPSMVMQTCPMALVKNCVDDSECESCQYRAGYGLKDRMNMIFRMERINGTTTIYNSVVLMVLDELDRIMGDNKFRIRLDYTFEREGLDRILDHYYDYLKGNLEDYQIDAFIKEYREENEITKGHFYRGII